MNPQFNQLNQRIWFEVQDPNTNEVLPAFVDVRKGDDGNYLTDWGVLYDQQFNLQSHANGSAVIPEGGRKVQPAWFLGIAEEKAKNAYFQPDDGKFYRAMNQAVK